MNKQEDEKSYIFFDGVCNFCNASINFIIKHDIKSKFRFASLQSDFAKSKLSEFAKKNLTMDSVILITNKTVYDKSTAALLIAKDLDSLFPLLYYCFFWIPQFIRDIPYQIIAKNRYRWFGKSDSCRLPSESEKKLFFA